MRGFSIFIWCLVTALMFYSAWRFKAPEIETDVMARVSEQVLDAGGNEIAVEVDGRHVNLRGFASSASQKADLLDTADNTYGALGPIDGLLLPRTPTRTFLSAARNQTGVVLSGVVGSQEERDMVLNQAKTAGLGNVTDDLTVADGQVGWIATSEIGFEQLAALDSGHLYVSDDRQALSGTAPSTDVATAASNLGNGWQSFVSGPALEDPRIAELTGTLDERNTQLNTLGNQIADRDDQIKALNSDLDGVRTDLTATQTRLTGLETNLGQKQAHINLLTRETKSKALNLSDLSQTADTRAARIAELEAELAAKASDATGMESKLSEMTASLALLRSNGGEEAAGLEAALAEKTAEVTELETELVALNSAKDSKIADLDAQLASLSAEKADLDAQVAGLTTQNSEANATIDSLNSELATLADEKSGLMAQLDAQESTLTTANQSLESEKSANAEMIAKLQAELDETKSVMAKTDAERLDAITRSDDLNATVVDQTTQLANLTQERDALSAQLSEFDAAKAKLGTLETTVTERDAKIVELMASLQNQPSQPETQTAAQCNETAKSLLSTGKINFVTNSADIVDTSEPLLERITGVVLACSGPETDASVTIAGHTDSRGSDSSNQALSEARAQSVASFMIDRGVDPKALKPVGFGEAEPIADNDTTEGRAQNRRISFDFQAR